MPPRDSAVRHLTTEELAVRLGLQPRTLDDWRVDGTGPPYIRIGRGARHTIRYRESDVEDWEKSQLVVPATA